MSINFPASFAGANKNGKAECQSIANNNEISRRTTNLINEYLVEGESSLLPRRASALRARRGPMSVRAIADSPEVLCGVDGADDCVGVDGFSVSDSSSVSESVSSEDVLVSSSSSSSFFTGSSLGGGGAGAARLPR